MEHVLVPAEEALQRLKDGNARAIAGNSKNQGLDLARMRELAKGQDPWVIFLTCIDSRVVVERIFDLETGDAFTPRTIGNTVDDTEYWAFWYAAFPTQIRLGVILCHEKCGAVQHAIKGKKLGKCIDGLVDAIQPAVDDNRSAIDEALTEEDKDEAIKNTVISHAKLVVDKFRSHPDFKELVESGELMVVSAYYNFASSEVEWLEVPQEAAA